MAIETRELVFNPTEFRPFYSFQVDTNTAVNNSIAKSITITAWYQDDPTNKYRVVVNGAGSQSWLIPYFNSDGTYSGQSYAGSVASVDFVTPTFIPLPTGPNTRKVVVDYSFETDYFVAGIIRACSDASLNNQVEFDAATGVMFSTSPRLDPTYQITWNPSQVMAYYQFAYRLNMAADGSGNNTFAVGKTLNVSTWYASKPNDVYETAITIGDQAYPAAHTSVVFFPSNPSNGVPFSNESIATYAYLHVTPTLVTPTQMPVDHVGDPIVFEFTADISYIENFNILMSSTPNYASYSDQIIIDRANVTSVVPRLVTSGTTTPPSPTGPTAHPDAVTTPYNTAVTVSPAANDQAGTGALVPSQTYVVIDGSPVQSGSVTGGDLVVNSDGTITFTPTTDFSGDVPFTYRVTDTNGFTSDSTVTVTVQAAPVITGPTAHPDAVTTPYNTAVTVSPAANDQAGTGALVPSQTYVIIGGNPVKLGSVANGDITVNDNGTITFTPANGFSGDVPFAYRITDTNGFTSDSTVTVTVQAAPVITGPTAHPDAVTTPYNTAVTVSPAANDQAGTGALVPSQTYVVIDGSPVQSGSVTGGDLVVNSDGTITFTPTTDFSGDVPFTYRVTDTNGFTSDSTITVTVQAAPVITGPTARPDIFVTAYNSSTTFSSTGNDAVGSGALVPSQTYVIDNDQPVKTVVLTGATVTVNDDGTIFFAPTDGFSGDVIFTYRITDVNGLTSDSTVTVTVQAKVVVVVEPSPIRGAKWFLGDFATGVLDAEPFAFSDDSVTTNIHGKDEADVTIPLYGLSIADRIDWKNKFEPGQKMAALLKDDEVVFAGPIAKRDPNFKDEKLVIKARGFKWWLETIFVKKEIGQSAVTSDTEKLTIKASPATVVKTLVKTALTGDGYPQTVVYPDSFPGEYVFEVTLSELTSVSAAMDKIASDAAGVETTFKPRVKTDADGNRVIEFVLTAGQPHLNEDETTISVDLNNDNQVVDFSQIDDITDARNRWWLGSNVATGSNLQAKEAPGNTKLIREGKDKFSVTLTDTEMAAQYSARFDDSNKRYLNTTLSLWDTELSLWNQTGRRFTITGNARSAGFDDTVRCTGVKFSSNSPVVQLTVDAIRRVYPTLPNEVDDALKWKNLDSSTSTPWNMGDTSTGALTNADLWGDAGLPSNGQAPSNGPVLHFSNFAHLSLSPDYTDGGRKVIHPATIVQGAGNRFFGLDKNRFTLAGVVPPSGPNKIRDIIGFDKFVDKFYIRSAFLNNGNISQIISSGSFAADLVYSLMDGMDLDVSNFAGDGLDYTMDQKAVSIEVVGSMFASVSHVYFQVAVIATHFWEGHKNSTGERYYIPLKQTGTTGFWSAPVSSDGYLTQEWYRQINLPNNEFSFPAHMTKYGDKIAYTSAVVIPSNIYIPVGYPNGITTELTPETVPLTQIFKTLPIQQLPRVRAQEGGVWYSFPQTSLDTTSPHGLYGVTYNGWMYAIHSHKQSGAGIYRIRVTADGVIPPDAVWVRTGDLDWTDTPNISYGLAVVPGFVVFSSNDGTSYYPIKDDSGAFGDTKVAVDPAYGIFTSYKGSNNSDYDMKNEYRDFWPGSSMPESSSRPLSYGGYIYWFYSSSANDSTISLYSVKTTS